MIELAGLYQEHARAVYRFALFLSGDAVLGLWHCLVRRRLRVAGL